MIHTNMKFETVAIPGLPNRLEAKECPGPFWWHATPTGLMHLRYEQRKELDRRGR